MDIQLLDPDYSVNIGDDRLSDELDLTFSVICMILAVILDTSLTAGLPIEDLVSRRVVLTIGGTTIPPDGDIHLQQRSYSRDLPGCRPKSDL